MKVIGVSRLIKSKNVNHLFVAARWYYKLGEPIITDDLYDKCEKWVKENNPGNMYLTRSWEQDTEPTELIDMYDLPQVLYEENTKLITKHLDSLIENKSISIRPVHNYKEAYDWFKGMAGREMIFSLKVDGINTKTILNTRTMSQEVTSSRGRNTDNLKDYTYAVSKKLPSTIPLTNSYVTEETLPLYGEGYLSEEGLDLYDRIYGKRFKTPRSGAMSVLEVPVSEEIYNHLKVKFFRIENYKNKMSECLEDLDTLGLDTVPWLLDTYTEGTLEEFTQWIDNLLGMLREFADGEGIPSDGVVVELNDRSQFKLMEQSSMYSEGNLALKIGPWKNKNYTAKVEQIIISSSRGAKENKGVLLRIEPTTVGSGETINFVNAYNLSKIVENNIKPGKSIEFTFVSDSIGVLA